VPRIFKVDQTSRHIVNLPSTIGSTPGVVCRTLEVGDLESVEKCLVRHFPERPPTLWRIGLGRLTDREAVAELPRFGYCLAAGDEIVGVLLQLYSMRKLASGTQTLCHLSSWCVDENYRAMAPILSIAATKRKDVTYVNISPAAHTRRAIEALGFKRYSHGQMIFAPMLSRRRKAARIVGWAKGSEAEKSLPEIDREILERHDTFGCRVFVGVLDGATYGFVTAKTRVLRGRLPCERVVYCRDTATLAKFAGGIGAYLATRGVFFCLVDTNEPIDGLIGRFVEDREPKYFKGPTLPTLGDLAYSELAVFNQDAIRADGDGSVWRRARAPERNRIARASAIARPSEGRARDPTELGPPLVADDDHVGARLDCLRPHVVGS
jgi:hypothetical protein